MQKLLFISDPHICVPGETIVGLNPSNQLQAVLEAATNAHPDAAAIIILGDLTHHGSPEEYQELQRILKHVTISVIPMMGNHDRREAFFAQFPHAPQMTTGHVQHRFDLGQHRIITLDSLDGPSYVEGHHKGRLCPARLQFLGDALATRAGRHALVCIHHPPFKTGIVGMDAINLIDGKDVLDLLAKHGDMHLICGHIHRTMSGSTRGIPWSMFKSPCHQGVIDLVTTNSRLSSNEPGPYGLALLADDGVVIHTEDIGLTNAGVFGGYGAKD